MPHSNVLALIDATRDDFGLTPGDTWTLFHSSAFDFSVWEIWGALLTGARLVVVDYWVSRSPADFHALLVREGVTVLSQTPSAFTQLMAADREHGEHWGRGTPLALRLVVLGGEPLDARPLRDWFDRHPEDRSPARQHVRHHRDDGPCDGADGDPAHGAVRVPLGGASAARLVRVRARRPGQAGPARGTRRDPCRRRRGRDGVPGPSGPDRAALRTRPVARRTDVPQRRSGQAAPGRHPGASGPDRQPGEGARLPDRAGRDPSRAAGRPVRDRGGGDGVRGRVPGCGGCADRRVRGSGGGPGRHGRRHTAGGPRSCCRSTCCPPR